MPNEASLSALAYVKEQAGAYTVPGPHHRDTGSQDTVWPSSESGEAVLSDLANRDVAQHGRLYLLADGVSLCADGKAASSLAVETAGNYYYQTASAYPNTDQGRMQRLEDAAWQAHLRVSSWDERHFCWRAEAHPDGVAHHFKREQLKSFNPPLCPLCNQPVVGLQTTLLAALVRGQQLMIVGVGDCSAFRLPGNPEHGVEWIFPPQDGQFCGMPSLTRESIVGQAFMMTPSDTILLASDGMVKVLNGLHADAKWHHMLRERLATDYRTQVPEMILDLDGWRLSKPRQRKLHDDLTLVAVKLTSETAIEQQNGVVLANYDALVADQQNGSLTLDDYRSFLQSAETALIADADPHTWQLYSTVLHHFALSDLAISADFTNDRHGAQLKSAAIVGKRGTEWVTVWSRLAELASGSVKHASSDTHTQITSDLYSADWPSAPVQLLDRTRAVITDAAATVSDASAYTSFLNYLDTVTVGERSLLPERGSVVATSAEEENVRALEMRVTQSIADGKWEEAQELIIELNKLKGATLNFDTEGVDTSPTRPVRRATPKRPARQVKSKAVARVVKTDEGRSELVMPFERVQRVFHSREPNALLRDTAHAAFSSKPEHFDLGMAADLLQEAAKLYPLSAVMPLEWQALWDDPNAEFELVTSAESDLTFERLSDAMAIARDLHSSINQSLAVSGSTLMKAEAKEQQTFVKQWEETASDANLLPYRLGRGAWWQACSLLESRLLLPQPRDNEANSSTPSAEKQFAIGLWSAIQAQSYNSDVLDADRMQVATDALGDVVSSKERPLDEVAFAVQSALAHDSALVRAYYVDQLATPGGASADFEQQVRCFKKHSVGAAWEYVLALSEGRMVANSEQLERDRSAIVGADFDVTALDGPNAIRLSTAYDLLNYLINEKDGAIINGFYAYELKVPKKLSESDYQRLSALREHKIAASWHETLSVAAANQPFYLPPSGKGISRIKPDKATPEGRRLQAVRAMLPHLSQSYDNWIDYAAFVFQWKPPLALSAEDQQQLDRFIDTVVGDAWKSTLSAIRGQVVQNLGITQLQSLNETYAAIETTGQGTSETRMGAIRTLIPLLQTLRNRNATHVSQALGARTAYQQLAATLSEDDMVALDDACDAPVETMWRYAIDAAAGSNSNGSAPTLDLVQCELDDLDGAATYPSKDSVWQATGHLLHVATRRLSGDAAVFSEDGSQELFKAFRSINLDEDPDAERRNRELYEVTYHQLVQWKDSLPVQPGLLQRRRINAEKRRIQEYWLLRKEYGM